MRRVFGSEEELCFQLARYMQIKHPDVLYHFAVAGWPAMFIARLAYIDGDPYCGLFIELKRAGESLIRKKDRTKALKGEYKIRKAGDWYDLHIEEQADTLAKLEAAGYRAEFAIGFDQAVKLIEDYLA